MRDTFTSWCRRSTVEIEDWAKSADDEMMEHMM